MIELKLSEDVSQIEKSEVLKPNVELKESLEKFEQDLTKEDEKCLYMYKDINLPQITNKLSQFSGLKQNNLSQVPNYIAQLVNHYHNALDVDLKSDIDTQFLKIEPLKSKESSFNTGLEEIVKFYQKHSDTSDSELENLANVIYVGDYKITGEKFTFKINTDPTQPSIVPFKTLDQNLDYVCCCSCKQKVEAKYCTKDENGKGKDLELCLKHQDELKKLVQVVVKNTKISKFDDLLKMTEKSSTTNEILDILYGDVYPNVNKLIYMNQKLYKNTQKKEYKNNIVTLQYLKSSILFYKTFLNPLPFMPILLIIFACGLAGAGLLMYTACSVSLYLFLVGVFGEFNSIVQGILFIIGALLIVPIVIWGIHQGISKIWNYFKRPNASVLAGLPTSRGIRFDLIFGE